MPRKTAFVNNQIENIDTDTGEITYTSGEDNVDQPMDELDITVNHLSDELKAKLLHALDQSPNVAQRQNTFRIAMSVEEWNWAIAQINQVKVRSGLKMQYDNCLKRALREGYNPFQTNEIWGDLLPIYVECDLAEYLCSILYHHYRRQWEAAVTDAVA